jgi:hypothetical protein
VIRSGRIIPPGFIGCVGNEKKYPEDVEHKETELFAAPANRQNLLNFVQASRHEESAAPMHPNHTENGTGQKDPSKYSARSSLVPYGTRRTNSIMA